MRYARKATSFKASRLAGFEHRLASVGVRVDEEIGYLPRPVQRPRYGNHDHDPASADHELFPYAPRVLHEYPVRGKRQEYAEAEDRQRMPAAHDERLQPSVF